MPAYFSLEILFSKDRIKPNFVKNIYSIIIESGFIFKSGYWFLENSSFDEIINWNQDKLNSHFRLRTNQNYKEGYMQIMFDSHLFDEFRGFWMYRDNDIAFNIIIPESEIMEFEGGSFFLEDKILVIKKLAESLWQSKLVDAIQTSLELEENFYDLKDINSGMGINITPFAILPNATFLKYYKDHSIDKEILKIQNEGLLIYKKGEIIIDL